MSNELQVINFMHEHINWRELLSAEPYCLKIKEDDELILLTYNQLESDFNQQICRECRGLIIEKSTLEPVALSFEKFFNVQESFTDEIDWNSAVVREKIDGSKILVFYYKGWHVATSGALDAYKTPVTGYDLTFGDIWDEALKNNNLTFEILCSDLNPRFCYTFELVSPETRVVISYPEADIYLIGARNTNTWKEACIESTFPAFFHKIKTPKKYSLSNLEDCLKAANQLGSSEEGFVVQDKYFRRVKIKSPSYVALHHLRLNGPVTESRILEVIENGECSEFFSYFPEYLPLKESVENKKNIFFSSTRAICVAMKCEYLQTSRKETAQHVMRDFKDISSIIFKFLESDLDIDEYFNRCWKRLSFNKKCGLLRLN